MITNSDLDEQLFLFPIEDVSSHEVKVLEPAEIPKKNAGNRPVDKSTFGKLTSLEAKTHAQELIDNLVLFRSSMSRLGRVFGNYAMRPDFWFATMCFENWLALNSRILNGSWLCPSETRDGLRNLFTQKGLDCRTLDTLAQNHDSHGQIEESVHRLFQRAEVERQRFETAYNILRKLDDSNTIESKVPGSGGLCLSVYRLPHPDSSKNHSCLEYHSCSEPVHLLGSLDRIGGLLQCVVEAAENDPDLMSSLKARFETSSSRSYRLERDLAQLKALRHIINIHRLSDNSQDSLISTKIEELKQNQANEKCLRQKMISCLLEKSNSSFDGIKDLFEADGSH